VRESVRQLRDKLEDFWKEEIKKISDGGKVLLLLYKDVWRMIPNLNMQQFLKCSYDL